MHPFRLPTTLLTLASPAPTAPPVLLAPSFRIASQLSTLTPVTLATAIDTAALHQLGAAQNATATATAPTCTITLHEMRLPWLHMHEPTCTRTQSITTETSLMDCGGCALVTSYPPHMAPGPVVHCGMWTTIDVATKTVTKCAGSATPTATT